MFATVEMASDKLGRAAILLPVVAFAGLAIAPVAPGPETLRLAIALLLLGGLLVSGPFGAWALWQKRRTGRPDRRLAMVGCVTGLGLSLYAMVGMHFIGVKAEKERRTLEERQRVEAQSPAAQ